jgi:hypothetical protein
MSDEEKKHDHALVFRYREPDNYLDPLDLPPAPSRAGEHARRQIIAGAVEEATSDTPFSHSRNKNKYTQRGDRYDAVPGFTYANVVGAIDELHAAGLLDLLKSPADPTCKWQSQHRASPKLVTAGLALPHRAPLKPRGLIRLRDHDKHLINFRDTERTERMRQRLIEINEAITNARIELPADVGKRSDYLLHLDNGTVLNLDADSVYRVFNNGSFQLGGRFYGTWWQGVPKVIRQKLTINGEPVVEPDFEAHHIRMLYAEAGLPPPAGPYEVGSWQRDQVKLALLILINALNGRSAIGAIMKECGLDIASACRLVQDIKRRHAPISEFFHSDAGRRLQCLDAEIAEKVMLSMTRRGITVLGIHDSFVAPARHEGLVREVMEKAFAEVTR